MMARIKILLAVFAVLVGIALPVTMSETAVYAQNALEEACQNDPGAAICNNNQQDGDVVNVLQIVINTMLFIVGAISVIMIIIGGLRYATSSGDSGSITSAKNTILYAVIGLVIAFLAYAIVNWVLQIF